MAAICRAIPASFMKPVQKDLLMAAIMWPLFFQDRCALQAGFPFRHGRLIYGFSILCIEFVREPDAQLQPCRRADGLSMGQWLTIPMIFLGLYLVLTAKAPSSTRGARCGAQQCRLTLRQSRSDFAGQADRGLRTDKCRRIYAGGQSRILCQGDPLGVEGDFITAPEVSQMFGELIGLWLTDLWIRAGRPNNCHYVELGPRAWDACGGCIAGHAAIWLRTAGLFVETSELLKAKCRAGQCRVPASLRALMNCRLMYRCCHRQ
jgi:hypothetical protein